MENENSILIVSFILSLMAVLTVIYIFRLFEIAHDQLITYFPIWLWLGWVMEYCLISRPRASEGCLK